MSEMNDSFIYNFYDYVKSIYIYSHVKTNLKDAQRQGIEQTTNVILIIISLIFVIISLFKIFVIIFYFIFIQAFSALIKFIITIVRFKCNVNFCSSFKNAFFYLMKVFKRIYTFNFYLFDTFLVGLIMIFSYFFFLISSCFFYFENYRLIETIEKPKYYMITFYCHFESVILIQLLCSSFYSCRDMKMSTIIGIGLFIIINLMILIGYQMTVIVENAVGSYELDEPQSVMNMMINSILLFLNGICLYNVLIYDGNSKLYIIKFYYS